MNDFIKNLQASSEIIKNMGIIQEEYSRQCTKLEFEDKVALAIYSAILELKTENKLEKRMQEEYMRTLNKVLCNYDELKPIIEDALKNKKGKDEDTLDKED